MVLSRVLLAAALLAATTGCSLALKTDAEQCTVDQDCAARGSAFAGTICKENVCVPKPDPKWGCVGSVPAEMKGQMVTVTVQLVDLLEMTPAQNLDVKLCNKLLPDCSTPLGTPTPDASGKVTVTFSSDQDVYLDVQSTDQMHYLPSVVVLDHFAWEKQGDILLVPSAAVPAIAAAAKVTIDPAKGIILMRTVDCQEEPTAGASMTLSPGDMETRFFVINNSVTQNAAQTDASGNAGYANVDPGVVTLTATIGDKGKEYGTVTTIVRAGTVTFQALRPTSTL